MATPVVTDKWAGNFDCTICRRKRLVGSEFSKKALERYRKTGAALKCKKCTSAQEEKERIAAAAKAAANGKGSSTSASVGAGGDEMFKCASCKESLSASLFNKNQLSKRDKARCRKCVERALKTEDQDRKSSKQAQVDAIKKKIEELGLKGNVQEKLKYESQLSALEAEHVTGLKPIVMGRGRGSWRSRGGRGGGRGGRGGQRNSKK